MPRDQKTLMRKHPVTGCRPDSLFGPWAIEPSRFRRMHDLASGVDLSALAANRQARIAADGDGDESLYEMLDDGIARIAITGPITLYPTSFSELFGGTSSILARRAVRAARMDANVRGVLLEFDTPGGTVSGLPDLADEVFSCRQEKPVVAYVTDLCCSAGYWIASQADQVITNASGCVGCIGVYAVLQDTRGLQDRVGVRSTLVATGRFKGLGADGEVTQDLIDDIDRENQELNDLFIDAVCRGRGWTPEQATELADGRSYFGVNAVGFGLADSVMTHDEAMQSLIDFLNEDAAVDTAD